MFEEFDFPSTEWRKHIELILSDEQYVFKIIREDFESFTQLALAYPKVVTRKVTDLIMFHVGTKWVDARTYYQLLRILPIMMEVDYTWFNAFDDKYKDQQFIETAYAANVKIEGYLSKFQQRIYIQDDWIARTVKSLVKTWKVFVAGLGV